MVNTIKTSIVEKIQKLLELSSSTNEHEAQAAANKAKELLLLHNISMSELSGAETDPVSEHPYTFLSKTVPWKECLIIAASAFYGCQSLFLNGKSGTTISIIGTKGNVMVCQIMISHFMKEIDRVVAEAKVTDRKSGTPTFRHGVALRIASKMFERTESLRRDGCTTSDGEISALVVQSSMDKDRKGVDDWMSENCPNAEVVSTKDKKINDEARSKGFAAGASIGIDTQITGRSQPAIAG